MSDYCVCKDCGCKHLVWEKSCPYCRRIKELEAENADLGFPPPVIASHPDAVDFAAKKWAGRIAELEAQVKMWQQQSNAQYLYLCELDKTVADEKERIADKFQAEAAKLREASQAVVDSQIKFIWQDPSIVKLKALLEVEGE